MQKQRNELIKNLAQKFGVKNRHEVHKIHILTTMLSSET
jgi:hypothetical protein